MLKKGKHEDDFLYISCKGKVMSKQVTVALAGLGSRGKDTYAKAAEVFPEKMKIVAIADIDSAKVEEVAKLYNVPKETCFSSAEDMIACDKLADVMFITTQDRQHVKQAIPAMEKGYHLLLEKPISPLLSECNDIVAAAKQYNRMVVVCHVLRYTPYYTKVKEVIDAGDIGDVVSIMAVENVGYYHQAHSFVRGNWANAKKSSPMILQKCCHDMDLYLWLSQKTCESVSSFGDTYLFKEEMAPKGSAMRCLSGCKVRETCPFDAEKIYMDDPKIGIRNGHTTWPIDVLALHPSEETIMKAIEEGPYGACVYHCDNNVVDHQIVNLNMTDHTTISLTMCGMTSTNSRYCKIMGTKGEMIADMGENTIRILPFGKPETVIDVSKLADDFSGHGGGDIRLVEEFLDVVSGEKEPSDKITSLAHSMESHYVALAAEESRLQGGEVIKLDAFRKK